ncbi:LytS/YhcK type 5TM receptor domain-containing protein [Gymnodinialimonas sp. 57CJ19]|uniref:LytS/YhcK type 5TM receptor domain-containing protein n=1 Tax=Gymnodinialimonas sp. 57CJ19 TaxID=3138498 RepID=UPI0031344F97
MNFSDIFELVATLALTGLLAQGYGIVRRKLADGLLARASLGAMFGAIAVVQMNNPIEPFDGFIMDLRSIPIALAGAFLGGHGLAACLAVAMMMRIHIGGVGMEAALWGMILAGAGGLAWSMLAKKAERRSFGCYLALALATSSHLIAGVFLPQHLAHYFFTSSAIPMLVLNLATVPLFAALLDREDRHIKWEKRLNASATHDPATGLLLSVAFVREMTNAYTARALGTFAGFLTIAPDRGALQNVIALFGDPAPVALDRQSLGAQFEHADLAGLCVDGRVLVPLSSNEVLHWNRLKANLTLALRDTPSAACGNMVSVSMHEFSDPHDFVQFIESALVSAIVAWGPDVEAPKQPNAQACPETPASISPGFNQERNDLLFAKAEFLMRRKKHSVP